jgi:hypothetical protein
MNNRPGSSPTVTNCTFSGNSGAWGGGMSNSTFSSPTVTDCRFQGNTAYDGNGGGMFNLGSSPTVTDCTFSANSATRYGGGMHNHFFSNVTVTNCYFGDNLTVSAGGGMATVNGSNAIVTNCTFSGNSAANGNALAFDFESGDMTMANCILWDGGDEIWNNNGSTININHSNVQGGWPGTGNIDSDPMCVDPANGDLRLLPGSPCIDAGHNNAIAGLADTDLDGNPRFVHGPVGVHTGCGEPAIVDMGAYEFPNGTAVDIRPCDIDGDGLVGLIDFTMLLNAWGPCVEGCCLADFDLDGSVGILDFLLMLSNWG